MLKRFLFGLCIILVLTGFRSYTCAGEDKCATILAVGDILLDRGVKRVAFIEDDPYYPFRKLQEIVAGADVVLGNLECALTEKDTPYNKIFLFKADPTYAYYLRTAGFTVLTLANNHSYDYGREALLETMEVLKQQGITTVGVGKTLKDASRPVFIEVNGLKIAIVGFVTLPLEGIIWSPEKPSPASAVDDIVAKSLKRARKNADVVIVTVHWGTEYSPVADPDQLRWAAFFREHGADIVFGHHPHVIQPIEVLNGRWIFYSLGNFVFDHQDERGRLAIAARVTVCQREVRDVNIIPIEILNTQPTLAGRKSKEKIYENLNKYSDTVTFHFQGRSIRAAPVDSLQ